LSRLRKTVLLTLSALLVWIVLLLLWRLFGQVDMAVYLAHLAFMLTLIGYTAGLVLGIWRWDRRQPLLQGSTDTTEAVALGATAVLVWAMFLLCAWAHTASGNPPADRLPGLSGSSHLTQAAVAGLTVTMLIAVLHLLTRKVLPTRDPWLLPLASILAGSGLALLFRLGPDIARIRKVAGFDHLFVLQFRSLILAAIVFSVAAFLVTPARIESLTRKRYVYVLLAVVLITLTAIFGVEDHGRRLSLNLGLMRFQTVELVKLLALLFMVGYFRYEKGFVEAGKGWLGLPRGRYLMPYLTLWGLTLLPIFLQKDLGPTALLFALFLLVFYLGTGSGLLVISGLAIMGGMGVIFYHLGLPSMVRTRVDMWLDPFAHSQNMAEVMWALSSGGGFGVGLGREMSHLIPVVQSDFNLVALAEAWGMAGLACIIVWFALLVQRTIRFSLAAVFPYQQMLIAGLGALWAIQTFIIIAGNMGLLPLTGITLPFISYGGSSLLVNFLALGIIMRMSHEINAGSRS
jgi:cell division protein FtsW (lipid II flippase)